MLNLSRSLFIFVLDKQGRIRWSHVGEGDYEETEGVIRKLLAEENKAGSGLRVFVQGGGCGSGGNAFETDDRCSIWLKLDDFVVHFLELASVAAGRVMAAADRAGLVVLRGPWQLPLHAGAAR